MLTKCGVFLNFPFHDHSSQFHYICYKLIPLQYPRHQLSALFSMHLKLEFKEHSFSDASASLGPTLFQMSKKWKDASASLSPALSQMSQEILNRNYNIHVPLFKESSRKGCCVVLLQQNLVKENCSLAICCS